MPVPPPWLSDDPEGSAAALNATFVDNPHELLGMRFDRIEAGAAVARLTVTPRLLAGNGYLHAATLVALTDSAAGFRASPPCPPAPPAPPPSS
jgi:acyl-coenzyme A thioesterase PaaI-like protein